MNKAFVLGAGLGERLRPLTDQLPKPLVPVLHRPLITWAFEHLRQQLDVKNFVVNSWHLAEEYARQFPEGRWQDCSIQVRKDSPTLLDTAGGMLHVRDLLDDGSGQPFAVYNGDVMADFDLKRLEQEHVARKNVVTLGLRSTGPALHIAYNATTGLVTDIRNRLATGQEGSHLFTGVYMVNAEFLDWITPLIKESVIAVFLRLIQAGKRVGACLVDEGHWWDLGSRASYLALHREVMADPTLFPHYLSTAERVAHHAARMKVDEAAHVSAKAALRGHNQLGAGASVADGAVLEDCVLWPGASVAAGVQLTRCIIRQGICATEDGVDRDY
jgi:mannose-1-phosphate guanylyltransferase/mannose-1-phosphate guanylyltransferase/phosphomannomutase